MFSIYSDRTFLDAPARAGATHSFAAFSGDAMAHVPMLVPFWGTGAVDPGDPATGRYARYAEVGSSFLRLTTLDDCDAAIFPQSWAGVVHQPDGLERARHFCKLAHDANKPPVIFFWSDLDDDVPLDAIIFRTSLYRSRQRKNEFAQPAWSEDFLVHYFGGTLEPRAKRGRPIVGFCGFSPPAPSTPPTLTGKVRRAVGNRKRAAERRLGRLSPGHLARSRALRVLEQASGVETNFVVRSEFMGGAIPDGVPDVDALRRVRSDYVQNIAESDYVLCARGAGNFSYRLYEVLSCGRIPVFVDTDCVLPLDFAVDWRDYCVWVEERDISRIGDRVLEFHERLGDREFIDLQRACRRFWETHISPEGFFSHFHRHF